MNRTERYFRALGWTFDELSLMWFPPEGQREYHQYANSFVKCPIGYEELPNILENFPDFKKWVLSEMGRRGLSPDIRKTHDLDGNQFLGFSWDVLRGEWKEIINSEWLVTAVEVACEYLEGEK